MKTNCKICYIEFSTHPYLLKKGFGKYCGKECRRQAYKIQMLGKGNPFYGKKHSKKSIIKIKIAHSKISHDYIKTKFKAGHSYNFKTGKYRHTGGYICELDHTHPFREHNGYVLQHRLVVEKIIKRYLSSHEPVHHIDEIKTNNHPTNLMAFTSDSAHGRFHWNPANVKPEEIIFDGRIYKHN